MVITDEQHELAELALPIADSVLRKQGLAHDDDAVSFLYWEVCVGVMHLDYPTDPDHRINWMYKVLGQRILDYRRKTKSRREGPLEVIHIPQTPSTVDTIIRHDESVAAAKELAEHENAMQPGNRSRKQWYINRARRKRENL